MTKAAADGVAAVLLAAGEARRFGADKRRHTIDGEPMIARAVARYAAEFAALHVVLRPGDEAIADLIAPWQPRIVVAAHASEGMGHSLAAGVRALGECEQVVVALADMPFVAAETLRRLRAMMGPGRIARPMYRGVPGHPVAFSEVFLDELMALKGDQGARDVIRAHPDALVQWWVEDAGVVQDVDVPPPP